MKIVFLDTKTVGELPGLQDLRKFGDVSFYETTKPEEISGRISNAEIVITNKVPINRRIIESAGSLQLICIAATGKNNVDLIAAEEKGIVVTNVSDYSTNGVAQGTFALLLYLMNSIVYYDRYVKTGLYSASPVFTHFDKTFYELHGKRFGIIGMGNIGRRVARIAGAFGAKVVYYSTSGQNNNQKYPRVDLETLLTTCDVISIHAPLNENTAGLINAERLALMKPGAFLINAGRGGIVIESDLASAIDNGVIAGAGLDVYEHEPIRIDNPLLKMKHPERIVLMPHSIWATYETRSLLIKKVVRQIASFRKEKSKQTL